MKVKDKRPFNDKGEFHGYWERYYNNGNIASKGNYKNDELIGYWEYYNNKGKLTDKYYYIL